ncbi:TIGR03086 family metal-binding protein [Pseudonocardia endophytica]|uniref:Uncharacterized protein (TIGR03086 family) n=1 Tax=Pseudonocardia endophytica TaxID=401976 RepID=A0A4R1HCW5_PSEEN|nr:TIGR03086 family metal-binding protein [Pseudonocardia endophytica]TCK19877.1 uncharacterized protein (TIGR03086 family) [Pseudonocardia endophytica]
MIDLAPACTVTASLVADVPADRLDDPTPCTDLAVRDLIAHLDQVARGADTADPLGPGWRTDVPERLDALAAEWADPAAWEGVGALDLPNAVWGRIVLTEMVVHGWDLARAIGRQFDLSDEPTLRACLDHVAEFVPDAPVPQLWGPPAVVDEGAPLIDRIVAITGRTP